jgi:hypothetical protein
MKCIDRPFVDVRVCWRLPRRCSSHAFARRLPALLFLALIALDLTGCGSSDRSSDSERPPSNRTAYVAWQEWTRFGRSTVVYGGGANGQVNRAGLSERSEPLSSRVGDYWGSCGHPEWNGRSSGRPWSGAFVSWVMVQSGVSTSAFPRAGRHGQYLSALYEREHGHHGASFALHAPNEYAPKPGDLVCTGTAGPTLPDLIRWHTSTPLTSGRFTSRSSAWADLASRIASSALLASSVLNPAFFSSFDAA